MKESACLESIREAAIHLPGIHLRKGQPGSSRGHLQQETGPQNQNRDPDPGWFDEVAGVIYKELETDEKYLVSSRGAWAIKLLAELDLLKADIYEDDEDGSLGGSLGDFAR